jgi:hypothetical protein
VVGGDESTRCLDVTFFGYHDVITVTADRWRDDTPPRGRSAAGAGGGGGGGGGGVSGGTPLYIVF